ncbi:hypothetical protein [Sulfuracidifex tepidarius]|uniref:hypothetical protein n=1 Tax=Sulfuracidifex tepidarius TaxID=1294262 RepID=UPI0006D106E6|nr:hypothetical protein [Sulfuracidifex tepidarius]
MTRRDTSRVMERIEEELRDVKLLRDLDVSLTVSSTPLIVGNGTYRMRGYETVSELFGKDGVKGLMIPPSSLKMISPGLHAVCESCGVYPAVRSDDRGKRLCTRCYTVHELSKSKGFSSKLETYFKVGSTVMYPMKVEEPMPYLSGDIIDEKNKLYEPVKAPRRYLSVVKSDGNDAGEYFSNSLFFGEYIDKSFKVDYWVKKSFVEATDEAERDGTLNKGMVMRTLLGVQYMGGDDILLIGPAMTAPVITMNALSKASDKLGMSFKVGVVTLKYDTPIQFAIEAAEKLMEDGKIRRETKDEAGAVNEKGRNTLTLLFASSLVTKSSVEEVKREWTATSQSSEVGSLYKMKTNFSFWRKVMDSSEGFWALLRSAGQGKEHEERVDSFKSHVRVMEDVVEAFQRNKDIYYTVIYMMRQATRHKEASKLMLTLLNQWSEEGKKSSEEGKSGEKGEPKESSGNDKVASVPLADVFFMLKTALAEAGDKGESP